MTRNRRVIAISSICGLFLLGLTVPAYAAEEAPTRVTISGDVSLPGVTLQGLPGAPQTDEHGVYTATVEPGWSGTVTPTRVGYTFEPHSRTHTNIQSDQSGQDYTPTLLTFKMAGNVGVPQVVMKGLPGHPVTDEAGDYRAEGRYGWAGIVEPDKTGYEFEPTSRRYQAVREDQANQDYSPTLQMLTISDVIAFGDQPMPDVSITVEPNGGQTLTDASGRYVLQVPYGWTGRLVVSRPGYKFVPSVIAYDNLTTHLVDGKKIPASERSPVSRATPSVVRPQVSLAGAADEVVMVPTAPVDPTMLVQVKEDMGIMLQILRDKLSEPRTILGTLYDFGEFFGSDGRQVEALYLQGYGAVFVMEVSFPLAPSPNGNGSEPNQAGDPVWQRARQRMYMPGATDRRRTTPTQADPASFAQFEEDMIRTLAHAANIRHLASDETVTLTIVSRAQGPAGQFGQTSLSRYSSGESYSGGYVTSSGRTTTYMDLGSSGRTGGSVGFRQQLGAAPAASTVLTIQAAKADIDAFAQADLDFQQFRTKVKTFSY